MTEQGGQPPREPGEGSRPGKEAPTQPQPPALPVWPQPGAASAQPQPPPGWHPQHPPAPWPQSAAPPAHYAYPPGPPARKEPAIAVLISFFIPGVGHLYAGDTNTGVLLLAICFGILVMDLFLFVTIIGILLFVLTIPASLIVWIYAMVDSYAKATAYNRSWGLP